MITKINKIDFTSKNGALTLSKDDICDIHIKNNIYMKTHKDGWTIIGELQEDYYEWVNDFIAIHPTLGRVWGNFENKVYSDNIEGFNDFYQKHPPEDWDYNDI